MSSTLTTTRTTVTRRLATLLAAAVLATLAAVIGTTAPAHASSACDYGSRPGGPVLGGYVNLNGTYYRTVCATVNVHRYSANQITFSGWAKDSATDGRNEVIYAQFRVNGQWGAEKVIVIDGNEAWHTWSYPVNAIGYVDQVHFTACGSPRTNCYETYVYSF